MCYIHPAKAMLLLIRGIHYLSLAAAGTHQTANLVRGVWKVNSCLVGVPAVCCVTIPRVHCWDSRVQVTAGRNLLQPAI
jgi:hypothetical protein